MQTLSSVEPAAPARTELAIEPRGIDLNAVTHATATRAPRHRAAAAPTARPPQPDHRSTVISLRILVAVNMWAC